MTSEPAVAPLTLFVLIKALPSFLSLSHGERRDIAETVAASLPKGLMVRQFDCEAFSAMCSDIWMLENTNPTEANDTFERLRDSPIFAKPYFELVAILPAIENGWRRFEAAHNLAA
jgi:hypothetical protein